MSTRTAKVDGFIRKNKRWSEELERLRSIALDCGLTEEIKWRTPCYTYEGKNVVLLGSLKDCCTISFMKGALLKDPRGVLVAPGENTRSARYIGFTSPREVVKLKATIRAYVLEAIELERAGAKVDFAKDRELNPPAELREKLRESPALRAAFAALTPGRQRGYILHFSSAKQSKTRSARIDKCTPSILEGKGLHD